MFRETRTEGFARRAYDVHESWRRETLLHAIKVLNRADEDNAASILREMLEGDPDRPLAGDEREAWRRETLLHAIKVLNRADEDNAASILRREMLDAKQPPERNPGGAP